MSSEDRQEKFVFFYFKKKIITPFLQKFPDRVLTCFLIIIGFICETNAQIPGNFFSRDPLSPLEYKLNSRNELQHPVIQPAAYGLETSLIALKDSSRTTDKYTQGWKVNPVISISGGFQMMDRQKSVGAVLAGGVAEWIRDDKWSASIGYAISIQHPPDYVVKMADSLRILPGMGYAVRTGDNTYYSHIPFGHIGYKAGKYFHFELGRGKHFWGDGYRSLILSDNSSPYPYFRITTKIWRIKYTNLFARMDDISGRRLYSNARIKYTALHGLSWNVSKTVNISLFEMVVWQDRDSLSRRHLDLSYLNPLIFYRPVEFAQGSSDNVLIGLGTKIKAMKNLQVYAQVVIDEFLLSEIQEARGWWGNKFGGQLGIKAFDIITRGLSFQSEVNAARPFTYTHGSPIQAWTQMNQPLAHPEGTNFSEWTNILRYDYKGWTFREKFVWASFGRDSLFRNQGGNIFRSYKNPVYDLHNEMLQGIKSTLNFHELMVSKSLPFLKGWEIFAVHAYRFQKNLYGVWNDHYFQLGIRVQGLLEPVIDY